MSETIRSGEGKFKELKEFREQAEVNGIKISVGYDRGYRDYTIYFPQINLGEETYARGVDDQVLRISENPEDAKMVMEYAKEMALKAEDVYDLYKEVEGYISYTIHQ